MPYVLTLALHPDEARPFPSRPGCGLRPLARRWPALDRLALADQARAGNGPPPFALSLPSWRSGRPTLRLTLLDDALWPALARDLVHAPTLKGPEPLLPPPTGGLRVTHRTYADLVAAARPETHIRLRFLSPTSLRSRGMHVPLPDPLLVYRSWLDRWNAFAPEALRINVVLLDVVAAHVGITHHELHTEVVDLEDGQQVVGFVGVVEYRVFRAGKIGGRWLRRLNLLADYAVLCGTGYGTVRGMGQTARERRRSAARRRGQGR